MIHLLLFVIALAIYVGLNLWLERHSSVDHLAQQICRTCTWAFLAILFEDNWTDRIGYFIAYHAAFGLPFDLLMNKFTGKEPLYIGNTAWSDKLGRKWPAAFWGLKLILALIGFGTLIFGIGPL